MQQPLKVYIITGEPSGDLLASGLMRALRAQHPHVQFAGIGGESMIAQGFDSLFDIATLSVMGFWEVLPRLPLILRRRRQVLAQIKEWNPDIIVTVDSWGFASSILKTLKSQHSTIPVLHYVAPQVWAWNKGRAKTTARLVDRLATLLPYEPPYFECYGLQADFVGHPITERMASLSGHEGEQFALQYQLPADPMRICLLPGSRQGEVKRLLPVFIQTLRLIQAYHPNLYIVVPTVPTVQDLVTQMLAKVHDIPYLVVAAQQPERMAAFSACKFALAASGTVSLELAACRTPHIIAYTFNPITNLLARMVLRIKFVNLINILADKRIIPEFLVHQCKANNIAREVIPMLDNPNMLTKQVNNAQGSLAMLRLPHISPSDKVAQIVLDMTLQSERITQ